MNPAGSHQGQGALGNTDAPECYLVTRLRFIPVTGPALLTEQTVATTVSTVAAPRPIQRESVNAGAGVPARNPAMGGNATAQFNQHAPLDTGDA